MTRGEIIKGLKRARRIWEEDSNREPHPMVEVINSAIGEIEASDIDNALTVEECDDCISRKTVLKYAYYKNDDVIEDSNKVVDVDDILALPTVHPSALQCFGYSIHHGALEDVLCRGIDFLIYASDKSTADKWIDNYIKTEVEEDKLDNDGVSHWWKYVETEEKSIYDFADGYANIKVLTAKKGEE